MRTVYLCGGIHGLSDADAKGWREKAKALLPGFTFLDPMDHDYRGKEQGNACEIIKRDLDYIAASNFILVNATRASWGTAMEIVYAARSSPKPFIVAFGISKPFSPWLEFHVDKIYLNLEAACATIK